DIKDKQDKYETTTKASFEQISLQLDIAKEDLKKDNEQRYNKESKKLTEDLREIEQRLERTILKRLDEIERRLGEKCDEMNKIV
ncbi:unnamed protein product, partial [Didymodactylos carnosus]